MESKFTSRQLQSPTLEALLSTIGGSEAGILKIYSGKDHECRCGCHGTYAEPGSRTYKRFLNALRKAVTEATARLVEADYSLYPDGSIDYVNIPNGEAWKDHCYCLYFKE